MSGRLFLVGTPIGNLGDITLRALTTLREVGCIAAEDTRRTRALLTHFEIGGKTLVSCDAHASPATLQALVDRLLRGEDVALVSDAGMPVISDPGTSLVRLARERGIEVSCIPGVSAVTTAVAVSGLVESSFVFLGFLPRQGSKRKEAIARVVASRDPVVLFEAPHRTQRTLEDLAEAMPGRCALIARELTKLHEEIVSGSIAALARRNTPFRGEITLVIEAAEAAAPELLDWESELPRAIEARLERGESPRDVVDAITDETSASRRVVYRRVMDIAARLSHLSRNHSDDSDDSDASS